MSIWLLSLCGATIQGDKKYDDPTTMANNIISEMKNAGINVDVAPNKLRTVIFFIFVCIFLWKIFEFVFFSKKFILFLFYF